MGKGASRKGRLDSPALPAVSVTPETVFPAVSVTPPRTPFPRGVSIVYGFWFVLQDSLQDILQDDLKDDLKDRLRSRRYTWKKGEFVGKDQMVQ